MMRFFPPAKWWVHKQSICTSICPHRTYTCSNGASRSPKNEHRAPPAFGFIFKWLFAACTDNFRLVGSATKNISHLPLHICVRISASSVQSVLIFTLWWKLRFYDDFHALKLLLHNLQIVNATTNNTMSMLFVVDSQRPFETRNTSNTLHIFTWKIPPHIDSLWM